MAAMVDFAEQMDPKTLAEARRAEFRQATRVHGSFLAAAEKRVLVWTAERMPTWLNSDHLTVLGFAAQIATGVCYMLAAHDRRMLLAAIVCLAVNWFGDSLDGTLARVRQRQRPRYGFYVDHMIDSIGAVAMMGGLALSGYMHPVIAIGLLDRILAAFHPVIPGDLHSWRISSFAVALRTDGAAGASRDR